MRETYRNDWTGWTETERLNTLVLVGSLNGYTGTVTQTKMHQLNLPHWCVSSVSVAVVTSVMWQDCECRISSPFSNCKAWRLPGQRASVSSHPANILPMATTAGNPPPENQHFWLVLLSFTKKTMEDVLYLHHQLFWSPFFLVSVELKPVWAEFLRVQ